jgi:diguanylate cyclase (GGDEF)-like protein
LLLLEDEPAQRHMLESILQRAGYHVAAASNGDEALAMLAGGGYHLLVTDWDSPRVDGVALCRQARQAGGSGYVYILLLTSDLSGQPVTAGLEAGADDFIRKPAAELELLARLGAGRRIVQLDQSLREANARIHHLSITDPLLEVYNRRYLEDQLTREIERARRYGRPLSVALADLDGFKQINDRYGNRVGDEVLRTIASLALALIRPASDWVARYGGEELAIVLPETDSNGAAGFAEKMRHELESSQIVTSVGDLFVTASFGVAELVHSDKLAPHESAHILLKDADVALYLSKSEGRNRVTPAPRGKH